MYALKVSPDEPGARFAHAPHAPEAFSDPIAVIEADHAQQLAICDVLDRLAHNPRHGAEAAEIAAVHDYLCNHLPLHIADEEEDLFPLLRQCAAADDDLEQILEQLHLEHQTDRRLNDDLCGDIECLMDGHAFVDPARFILNAFVFSETQRRHLAWENAVVVTRARKCLCNADRTELGRRMAKRRGVEVPRL
jgi:hemerythrin-like domain-containing protein